MTDPRRPPADDDAAARRGDAPGESGLGTLLRRGVKSALARWAVRHRPQEASWPRPQDEATHPWDGRRHYAEEYSFVAVQGDLAAIARIEWLPERACHRVWLFLLAEGEVHALPGSGQLLVRGDEEESHWRSGGLEIDCAEPLQTWTVRFRGKVAARDGAGRPRVDVDADGTATARLCECRVDLTFTADAPPFVPGSDDDPELLSQHLGEASWDVDLLRGIRRRPLRAYVQVGAFHGSVALGPRILAVSAAGLREHAWGVRDWGVSDRALRCFLAERGAPRAWVHRAVFPWLTLEGGFVREASGLVPVKEIGVTAERRPERAPSHLGIDLEVDGAELAFEVETVAEVGLEMDGRGRVELAFVRGADGGTVGVLALQERTVPRPAR